MAINKQRLHHISAFTRSIKTWVLLVLGLLCLVVSAIALRQNNLTAQALRDDVLLTDKNNGDSEAALRTLREFTFSHMYSELGSGPTAIKPPIQLKYRYERMLATEQARASTINSRIYTDAQTTCERQFPTSLSDQRIACIEQYVVSSGTTSQVKPDTLYKFDFISPKWSPDIAGISLVFGGLFLGLCLVRVVRKLPARVAKPND